jgi:signal transduction histidine kinase
MTVQLQELDKLKAEFVSVASHELKTPINVVLGYVQLLTEGIYGDLAPKQRDVLGTIENQMQSLSRLVRQLLDVSRFEAGGGKLEPRSFTLADFLTELQQGFAVLAVQRGVRFSVVCDPGLPNEVTWDHDRMSEVLGNLLSNAFKFTSRDGDVELRVQPTAAGVRMSVRDTGAGIPEAQLPHVFEKFYQASNQPHRAAGSGLGLAIAKEIVEAHQGTISCDSTPGVGTTFTITMPSQVAGRRSSTQYAVAAGV